MLPSKTRDFNIGDAIELRNVAYEITAVSERTEHGETTGYAYTFRLHSEVEAERQAEREHQAELLRREAEESETL